MPASLFEQVDELRAVRLLFRDQPIERRYLVLAVDVVPVVIGARRLAQKEELEIKGTG
jgi:hypothetical protein